MRSILVISLMLLSAAPLRAQGPRPSPSTRGRVITALDKLMITGEPRHTSHDEGQWLQTEVSAAVARGDAHTVASEHTPHDSWNPDPTPDDAVAIRIIGPQHAPKEFAASLIQQCAPICRGF